MPEWMRRESDRLNRQRRDALLADVGIGLLWLIVCAGLMVVLMR